MAEVRAVSPAAALSLLPELPLYDNLLGLAKLATEAHCQVYTDGVSAVAFAGVLHPVGDLTPSLDAYVQALAERPPPVGSLVGERTQVLGLWQALSRHWPSQLRMQRLHQPLLSLNQRPLIAGHRQVRPATAAELPSYLAAGRAMFTEELQLAAPTSALRRRFAAGIDQQHCFGWFESGHTLFKCDVAFVHGGIAHLQGVWLAPQLRGQGLSGPLLAAVIEQVQQRIAPEVSLYCNDFNTPAISLYRRLGFVQSSEYASLFF